MPMPGDVVFDVVLCNFAGAEGIKRRPAVVISTDLYHANGADLVEAELTTQLTKSVQPTSYALQDWLAAGLHKPSVFRCYFSMALQAQVWRIGHLTDRDWQEARTKLRLGLAVM